MLSKASGQSRRLTLGRGGVPTPALARDFARARVAEVASGKGQAEERAEARRELVVGE
jgi:hypothetical protein